MNMDLIDRFIAQDLDAENTKSSKRTAIRGFLEWYDEDLETVSEDDLRRWANYELGSENKATSTVRTHTYYLSDFFQFLVRQDILPKNPVDDVTVSNFMDNRLSETRESKSIRSEKEVTALSDEEVDQLLEHLPAPRLRNELLIKLMIGIGSRPKEVVNLRLDDVEFHFEDVEDPRRIVLENAKREGEYRTVWYPSSLDLLLKRYVTVNRGSFAKSDESDYLFLSNQYEKLSRKRPNKIVKQAAEEAGIQSVIGTRADGNPQYEITAKSLRHTFGARSVRNGMDIHTLKQLMGHSNISTTERYLQFRQETRRDKMIQYGPEP